MRIAIDGRALTGRFTGDRTYWRNLLHALLRTDSENTYLLYTRLPAEPGELPVASNLTHRILDAPNERLWTLSALPKAVSADRASLLHVQYTVPPRCACPVITTVHDISFRLFPQWFPAKHRLLLNLTIPASLRRAAHVITDSESSRADMLRAYRVPEAKLTAILLGLPEGFAGTTITQETAQAFAKEQYKLDNPFILAVGVLQPRKNLLLLAEAFGKAKAKYGLPHRLALVGKAGWGTEQDALRQAAAKFGGPMAADAVIFPGYVPDADLPTLYRAASVFAYPSLYEGFGFPPLEAMACGTPALVSDAPAMPEIAGDAALIAPARDSDAWADALYKILTDDALCSDLIARGQERIKLFSWETTAARTLEIYRKVGQAK